MNTILVPTDFSEVAKNACTYALQLASQLKSKKIILYNAYQQPVVADVNMTPVEFIDFGELRKISEEGLSQFLSAMQPFTNPEIEMDTLSEYTLLTTGINEVCKDNKIDLIVMGVTGGGKLEETLIGSYAVNVAKHAEVPVIIVPPGAQFTPIEEVMLACDFNKVVETTPVEPIKKILDVTKAKLFVLNVDHKSKHFTSETPFESLMLDTLLYGYNPEYSFMDSSDFIEAINKFALEKEVDLIITIPKKHGLFEGLFHRSHTKQLAFHSHVPLMVIHE